MRGEREDETTANVGEEGRPLAYVALAVLKQRGAFEPGVGPASDNVSFACTVQAPLK